MKRATLLATAVIACAVAMSSVAFSQSRKLELRPTRTSVDQRVAELEKKIAALELQVQMMNARLQGAVKQGIHLTE